MLKTGTNNDRGASIHVLSFQSFRNALGFMKMKKFHLLIPRVDKVIAKTPNSVLEKYKGPKMILIITFPMFYSSCRDCALNLMKQLSSEHLIKKLF